MIDTPGDEQALILLVVLASWLHDICNWFFHVMIHATTMDNLAPQRLLHRPLNKLMPFGNGGSRSIQRPGSSLNPDYCPIVLQF